MKLPLILLAVLALLAVLWMLAIRPRRRCPEALKELARHRYAHRGFHDDSLPENSLGAFHAAVAHGFGAELDVHLTRDGQLAVMHDESLQRMCGEDMLLCNLTAPELKRFRLAGTDERIPFLEEVLPIFAGRQPLVIELKTHAGNATRLCQTVMQQLDRYSGLYCIESFDPRVVLWFRRHRPEIVRGQLSANFTRSGDKLNPVLRFALHNLLTNFLTLPDFIAFRFEDRNDRSITLLRRLYGPQEFYWTLRAPEQQRQAEAAGGAIIFEGFDPSRT